MRKSTCENTLPLHERPDGSGRHVLSLAARAGFTGDNTPIYERYYAGGFSSIRGFQFRGASPQSTDYLRKNDCGRRRLPDARLGRIHVPHHGRRHAPRACPSSTRARSSLRSGQVARTTTAWPPASACVLRLPAMVPPGSHRLGLRHPRALLPPRRDDAIFSLFVGFGR